MWYDLVLLSLLVLGFFSFATASVIEAVSSARLRRSVVTAAGARCSYVCPCLHDLEEGGPGEYAS